MKSLIPFFLTISLGLALSLILVSKSQADDSAQLKDFFKTSLQDVEFNKPGGTANAYTTVGKFAWRGPYAANVGADPWGYAYVVNAGALAFGVNQAAFVISAGPNSKIETAFTQSIGSGSSAVVIGGDDIAARIR